MSVVDVLLMVGLSGAALIWVLGVALLVNVTAVPLGKEDSPFARFVARHKPWAVFFWPVILLYFVVWCFAVPDRKVPGFDDE